MHLTDELRALPTVLNCEPSSPELEALRAWNRVLADAGYAAMRGRRVRRARRGLMEQVVYDEEMDRAERARAP